MTLQTPALEAPTPFRAVAGVIVNNALVLALITVFAIFSFASPTFLTIANLQSILVNNFTLLAIVAIAMTFAVSVGGIDLSVGTAVDFASFAFVSLVLAGQPVAVAALAGLGAGAAVGAFNAVLISGIGISPFLATLGTLFIGRSIQQLLTNGGNPVYLPPSGVPEAFRFLGRGAIAGIPVPLIIAAIIILGATVVLTRARFGRVALAIGIQASVVRYSGIAARAPCRRRLHPCRADSGGGRADPVCNGHRLHSLVRQRLPAQRDRRDLHRHDPLAPRPSQYSRHRARRAAARHRCQRPPAHRA